MDAPGATEEPVRILHVDDDPEFASMAATFLERAGDGFDVDVTTSPDEALAHLASEPVDCVVSDYDMPAQTGVELLATVREAHPDLPFVLYTGNGSEAVASEAIAAGVTDYVRKQTGTGQYAVLANRITNAVERYRSDRELEDSLERLSLFVEQSPLGVIEWNEAFELVRLNETATQILGYSEDELRGTSWQQIVPDDAGGRVGETVDDLLADRGGYHSVNANVRRDGDEIACEWHNRVVTDRSGAVTAVFSQFREVTDRAAEANAIERTNEVLSTLFEALPVGVLAEDADRNVLAANDYVFDLLGTPGDPDEAIGADCAQLAEAAADAFVDADDFPRRIDEIVAERAPVDDEAIALRDGRTVERSYRPTQLPGGDGHLWVYRDVTATTERERSLERERDRLDEFASVVSHDLRNPLNIAVGHTRLLREEYDTARVEAIDGALSRMTALVGDLLTLARAGAHTGEVEPVSLERLSEECWATVATDSAVLRIDGECRLYADRSRLKQLVENLFANAAEHGGSDVTVTVGGLDDGFFVADTGPGIPGAERARVFTTGYSTDREGTGFGLTIVQQVADAHGWKLRVVDAEGGGARFEITGVTPA
jgi:PAS domain S-box-containing protein